MKIIVTEKYAQLIPDDGYADGGEPYTDDEMDFMKQEPEMADMSSRPIRMPNKIKNILQKGVHDILKPTYFEGIPLGPIFKIFEANGVIPLQEDGTKWDGMLTGGHECGSDRASSQRTDIELAVKTDSGLKLTNSALSISWCKMPSGKMEVIGYIS